MKRDAAVGTYLHLEAFEQPLENDRSTATATDSTAAAETSDAKGLMK